MLPRLLASALFCLAGSADATRTARYDFDGNTNDSGGNGSHATGHGVRYTAGHTDAANTAVEITGNDGIVTGLRNYVALPDLADGLTDPTISLWVNDHGRPCDHGESYIFFGSGLLQP